MNIDFSFLERIFFPLNVSSIITTSRNDVLGILILVPEPDSWNMLRVTCHSSARLSVVENRELIHSDRSKIVTSDKVSSVGRCVNSVDVSSVTSLREHTGDFPTEFTGGGLPDGWVNKSCHSIRDLLRLLDIVEDLGVSLINSSDELGVSGPIQTDNSGGVDESDCPMERVSSLLIDLIDVNRVIVRTNGQEFLVWRVSEGFAPFSWLHQSGDSL